MLSTSEEVFAGFGPSKYCHRPASRDLQLADSFAQIRSDLRSDCPTGPGVYGMIDLLGRLIYVGMSRSLRKRTLTYFQQGSRDRKETRIGSRARRLIWEATGHELLALLREYELIRRFLPNMNVRHRRRVRLAYLFLTVEDAPRFDVAARLPRGCRYFWGPVTAGRRLNNARDALNRYFRLPDCPPEVRMNYRDEPSLFAADAHPRCLRGEVDACLAPCAATLTRSTYFAQLDRARSFLNGADDSPLEQLDAGMMRAVSMQRFERAAALRDMRRALESVRERLWPQPNMLYNSFVYEFHCGKRPYWLAYHESTICKVAPAPHDPRTAAAWLDQIKSWPTSTAQPVDTYEVGETQILASWFRRKPADTSNILDIDFAIRVCSGLLTA